MVTIGIIKNSSFGGGSGNGSPIPFGELRLIARGSQNGIANTGPLKPGDFVEGMKDARFKWKSARYNGGDITNRANYTPLVEVDLENDAEVIIPPVTEPGVIALPTSNYYYESSWEAADAINQPYINSWVDYIDGSGNLQHFILGGLENGCQLIVASSILDTNGCATCVLPVEPLPPVEPPINPPVLPTSNYYFQGIWEEGDTIHHPETNSWVDYMDELGNMDRFIIGGIENGCQLVTASSILGKSGCLSCTPPVYKSLLSFDYKGVGNITFRYLLQGATAYTQHTFANLINSGGNYATYTLDSEIGDPNLCIEIGSFERVSGSIVNANNFIYSEQSCVLPSYN